MVKLIAYSYDADIRCPYHTAADYEGGCLKRPAAPAVLRIDERGLPDDLVDREGNTVTPVFDTDEGEFICGACLEYID